MRRVRAVVLVAAAGAILWSSAAAAAAPPPAAPVAAKGAATASAPAPADLRETRRIGARLLARFQGRALRFVNEARDKKQLKQIAYKGYCVAPDGKTPVPMSLALLRTLDRLAARATPRKPLVLLSLYRPPASQRRAGSAHGRGMAADIAAYGGYAIHSRDPKQCTLGVLAVLRDLGGPRAYRLGLPKPPGTDPKGLLPPPRRPRSWPFFPAPEPQTLELLGIRVVAPRRGAGGRLLVHRSGYLQPEVRRWENERSAPLGHIGSARVRRAIRQARARGVNIHVLFPDALDHLHLDVVAPAPGR